MTSDSRRMVARLVDLAPSPSIGRSLANLAEILPMSDECLDAEGFGLSSCSVEFSRGWRRESRLAAIVPLASWQGLYERCGFGMYLHPCRSVPVYVLICDQNSECVVLSSDATLALVALLCTAERGNWHNREQDSINLSSRQRYWRIFGDELTKRFAEHDLAGARLMTTGSHLHCFGHAGCEDPWGLLRLLEPRTSVLGFVASVAAGHVRDGEFENAAAMVASLAGDLSELSVSVSWLQWVIGVGLRSGKQMTSDWQPPVGADWHLGTRWWNHFERAPRAPLDAFLQNYSTGVSSGSARALDASRKALDANDIANAWTLSSLIGSAYTQAHTKCSRPTSSQWSQSVNLAFACLKQSPWSDVIQAL